MPILNLKEYQDDSELMSLMLTSIMCFPAEVQERSQFQARHLLRIAAESYDKQIEKIGTEDHVKLAIHIGNWLGEQVANCGGWTTLANGTIGPGEHLQIGKDILKERERGIVIGIVLQLAIEKKVGISKAAAIRKESHVPEMRKESNGVWEPTIQNDGFVYKTLWLKKKFKHVAHLWAAYVLTCEKEPGYPGLLRFGNAKSDNFKEFVNMADSILEQGVTAIPPRGPRKTILDPANIWRIVL